MRFLRPPLRAFGILGFIIFDLVVLHSYVKAYGALPFTFRPPFVEQFFPHFSSVISSPTPQAQDGMLLDDLDWQGSKLIGKITNTNSYPVYQTTIEVSISPTQEPWEEQERHAFVVPTVIEAGKHLYFSKALAAPTNKQFWWAASITSSSEHTDEEVEPLSKDLKVSEKKFPSSTSSPARTQDSGPWGVAKQLDEVTWTIKVGEDSRIATPQETLTALNDYRKTHGVAPLTWDNNLAAYAKERATYLNSIRSTDKHEGFKQYIANEDNVKKLGFWGLGENSGYGHKLLGVHLIEWVYAADEGHNKNQLDSSWSHVGIGIEGLAVVFIFGGWKI